MSEKQTVAEKVHDALAERSEYEKHLQNHPEDLSLKYLADHQLPIFVRINTKVAAVVIVEAKDKSGKSVSKQIPNTDIPIELTSWLGHEELGSSFHLRKLLDDRILKLVEPSAAIAELRSPIAQRKMDKMKISRFSNDSDEKIPADLSIKPLNENANITPGAPSQPITNVDTISPRLKGLVVRYQEKSMTSEDFIDEVTSNSRTFSHMDWTFLRNLFPDNSELQAICKQQLSIPE
jgi:hypothetical protein